MTKRVGSLWWFARSSWHHLGCDHGTGRWAARAVFFTGLVPTYRRFRRSMRHDRSR